MSILPAICNFDSFVKINDNSKADFKNIENFSFSFTLDNPKENIQLLTRVSSANVLDEGLRIGGREHQMNSKVKIHTNKVKFDVC
jgi:hypothetical protein